MPSYLKGIAHAIASTVIMYLPIVHFSWLNITLGGLISFGANWLLSHSVATTTGASAKQM